METRVGWICIKRISPLKLPDTTSTTYNADWSDLKAQWWQTRCTSRLNAIRDASVEGHGSEQAGILHCSKYGWGTHTYIVGNGSVPKRCRCSPCFSPCWRRLAGTRRRGIGQSLFLVISSLFSFFVYTHPRTEIAWYDLHPRCPPLSGTWTDSWTLVSFRPDALVWVYADIILNCPSIRIYWAGWSNWICLFDVACTSLRRGSRFVSCRRGLLGVVGRIIVVDLSEFFTRIFTKDSKFVSRFTNNCSTRTSFQGNVWKNIRI